MCLVHSVTCKQEMLYTYSTGAAVRGCMSFDLEERHIAAAAAGGILRTVTDLHTVLVTDLIHHSSRIL